MSTAIASTARRIYVRLLLFPPLGARKKIMVMLAPRAIESGAQYAERAQHAQ
jgi:hypothetical protein